MYLEGTDGQIELMSNRVIIHREGWVNRFKYGLHTTHEIPLKAITSVNFCEASRLKPGAINFDFVGRNPSEFKLNTVQFARKDQDNFCALKDKIFEMIEVQ